MSSGILQNKRRGSLITARELKSLRYIPLAFICGAHGFALFAPYVLLFVGLMMLMQRTRPASV